MSTRNMFGIDYLSSHPGALNAEVDTAWKACKETAGGEKVSTLRSRMLANSPESRSGRKREKRPPRHPRRLRGLPRKQRLMRRGQVGQIPCLVLPFAAFVCLCFFPVCSGQFWFAQFRMLVFLFGLLRTVSVRLVSYACVSFRFAQDRFGSLHFVSLSFVLDHSVYSRFALVVLRNGLWLLFLHSGRYGFLGTVTNRMRS